MDLVLKLADTYVLSPFVYSSSWPEGDIYRQAISIFGITMIGGYVLYLSFATLSYFLIYDKEYMKHPKFLKNQVQLELQVSCTSIPIMTLFTLPIFLAEVRGYSFLYDDLEEYGYPYLALSILCFMFFNDMAIYWIHRWLHHPLVYKRVHKLHHKWLVPTPFASHAFDPLDGFLQSTPYHIFVFLMPLHKVVYLGLFVLVNFWTISIHDGDFIMNKMPKWFESIVNGAAHHTDHHLYFTVNYGQYFTLWDHIGGSFRYPTPFEGQGPLDDVKRMNKAKSA
ncbi:sterol-C5-desaturase [Thraustotheca clavata]|uniref:Sterol-C5-desaturase n=1 Tax=Thraustotheca clavata TaxID=74557 RepID=A0A1V9Z2R8_9STRA|nr:sterol-C5-desaturase [Thraustotheca clavata]